MYCSHQFPNGIGSSRRMEVQIPWDIGMKGGVHAYVKRIKQAKAERKPVSYTRADWVKAISS
jgi:hypothetical protein|tara:strand:- start:2502 stop:2687 length:186 start_codon:yes stop_codon:yes gene_type:complete